MIDAIAAFFGVFFIFGGFWFWIAFLSVFGGLVALADHEQNFWAAVLVGIFFLGIFHYNPLIGFNWNNVPWLLLGYGVFGVCMSYVKWIMYLKKRAHWYSDLKEDWREYWRNKAGESAPVIKKNDSMKEILSETQYQSFVRFIKDEKFISHKEPRIIPPWHERKSKLVSWALWWPAVIFWSLFNDYIVGFFKWAVRRSRQIYENLARKIFAIVGVTSEENDEIRYGG